MRGKIRFYRRNIKIVEIKKFLAQAQLQVMTEGKSALAFSPVTFEYRLNLVIKFAA
mgnify:CR=1 FL=1